jgi:hypothetical protein
LEIIDADDDDDDDDAHPCLPSTSLRYSFFLFFASGFGERTLCFLDEDDGGSCATTPLLLLLLLLLPLRESGIQPLIMRTPLAARKLHVKHIP